MEPKTSQPQENSNRFSSGELSLFMARLEQMLDAGQLVIGVRGRERCYECVVQLHIGIRTLDGKEAVLLDVDVKD